MLINVKKSACIRFGLRYKNTCANVVAAGVNIDWVISTTYLGVYFESFVRFKCSFFKNKAGFYRSFNAIFGKIGRCASQEVVFALIETMFAGFVVRNRGLSDERSSSAVNTICYKKSNY